MAVSTPLQGKQMKGSRVSALPCTQGELTVYATPWSQNWSRHFERLCFFRPIVGAGFRPHFLGPRNSKQELFSRPDGPDLVLPLAGTRRSLLQAAIKPFAQQPGVQLASGVLRSSLASHSNGIPTTGYIAKPGNFSCQILSA